MKPITNIKIKKKDLVKNFILVAILSVGVSLISNALTRESGLLITLIPGIVCVIIVAIFYLVDYLGHSSFEVNVETLLMVDKEAEPVAIPRFDFSEDMQRAVVSVLTENGAYKPLWKQAFKFDNSGANKGQVFVREFLEYLFIHWISTELNTYFNDYEEDSKEIIRREQMPDVLIKNRVIELISKPYEEREKFQKRISKGYSNEGEIVYMGGEDGVMYEMLEIELPRKSKVCREGNTLVIKNRNFDIRYKADFKGFSAVMPRDFERFYLRSSWSWNDTNCYKVNLKMSIKIKPFFLLSARDWAYMGWLDKIGEGFVTYFSFDDFIKRIGYEQAATSHIMFLNGLKRDENEKNRDKIHDVEYGDVRIIKVDEEKQ